MHYCARPFGRHESKSTTPGSAADPPRRDHEIVEVALFRLDGPGIPIVLEEHRVDAVRAEVSDPIQAGFACVRRPVDPQLKQAVFLAGVVESSVRLDAVPLAHRRLREQWVGTAR